MFERACWGRGFATEAVSGIAAHAISALGRKRLVCLVMPGHHASARVAAKIGMRFEREFVDEIGASWLYAMDAADFTPA